MLASRSCLAALYQAKERRQVAPESRASSHTQKKCLSCELGPGAVVAVGKSRFARGYAASRKSGEICCVFSVFLNGL